MYISASLLRRHVLESNSIEGISEESGKPLFDCHLAAARLAAEGNFSHPNKLHALLTRGVPQLRIGGGQYRRCGVAVGDRMMPHSKFVPTLMEHWFSLVGEYGRVEDGFEKLSHFLHAWLLCIHPYHDGNGRTSRLVWNMLRLRKGLPWHIESASNKKKYYAEIRRVEKVFRDRHPNVYP